MRLKCFPLLIVFISVFTLFESCRKTDKVPEKDEMTANLEKQDRFYNDYSSTDPHIIKLNAYFNRINKGNDFVKLTIERVGYPIWNKTQIVRTAARNGRGLADSITFSYIPFSEPNEEVVNACLIVRTSSNDTLAWWVCDWQYNEMPHGNTGTPGTAENTAMFFMEFQHIVFGDTSFVITDSTLFANPSWPAWGSGKRKVRFRQTISGGKTGRSADQVIQCTDIYWCGSPWASECIPDCDYLYCQYGICYLVDQQCECIMNCGGSGGDPYGDPPPGGGGTGGGGGTPPPPECIPFASRMANAVPGECPPGWIPPSGDPPPPQVNEDSLISARVRLTYIQIQDSANFYYNKSDIDSMEWAFTLAKNNGISIRNSRTDSLSDEVSPNLSLAVGDTLFGFWHAHQGNVSWQNLNICFSVSDYWYIYQKLRLNNAIVFATTKDFVYAIVITDAVKFKNYLDANNSRIVESFLNNLYNQGEISCGSCSANRMSEMANKTIAGSSTLTGMKVFKAERSTLIFSILN